MREIKAIIRRDRLDEVIAALHERPDLPGVTVSYVDGFGRRTGVTDAAVFGEVQMVKLEIVVSADVLRWVVGAIQRAAFTGRSGDGKIFVSTVDEAIDVRSGGTGTESL